MSVPIPLRWSKALGLESHSVLPQKPPGDGSAGPVECPAWVSGYCAQPANWRWIARHSSAAPPPTHTWLCHARTLSDMLEWHPTENRHELWRSNSTLSSLWLSINWQLDSLFDFPGRLSLWLLPTVLEMSCLWDGRRSTTPTLEPIMLTTIPVSWARFSPPHARGRPICVFQGRCRYRLLQLK